MSFDPTDLSLDVSVFDGGNPDLSGKLFEIRIVQVPKFRLTAVMADERAKPPSVYRYVEQGAIELDRELLDRVVVLCFERLKRRRLLEGDELDRTRIWGVAKWLERQLPSAEAQTAIKELSRHVERALVRGESTWRFQPPKEK